MRVAAIADIHGDLDAFGRGLTAIDGAYTDQISCLGDVVGLGAPTAPGGVFELTRDRCAIALARDRWVTGALRSLAALDHLFAPARDRLPGRLDSAIGRARLASGEPHPCVER